MYICNTPEFDEKIKKHNLEKRIDSLQETIRNNIKDNEDINIVLRRLFNPVNRYLKRQIGGFRLFARRYNVDGNRVLCFLDIVKRDDHNYHDILNDPDRFLVSAPIKIQGIIKDCLQRQQIKDENNGKDDTIPPIPLSLPRRLMPWLKPLSWTGIKSEEIVFESEEWISRFQKDDFIDFWQTYYRIIFGHCQDGKGELLDERTNIWLVTDDDKRRYVLLKRYDVQSNEPLIIFLIAPFIERPVNVEINNLIDRFGLSDQGLDFKGLAKSALRSYPMYILADESIWLTIEKNEKANLALSPEEMQLLEAVSKSIGDGGALPLFINGRAGSGKSTMLLYLFASYCARKQRYNLQGNPLFLTYNKALVKVAKNGVKKILSSNYHFIQDNNVALEAVKSEYFRPFQTFLLELLFPEERASFWPENHITFDRFKKLYTGRDLPPEDTALSLRLPQAGKWTPELSWYVIRTFIKGYRLGYPPEEYTGPEDYRSLPKNARTIDEDIYEEIYNTIWDRWYKKITTQERYWDDQDLIRKVLKHKPLLGNHDGYPVIFCDEAQDFTRIELQLIMRLSMFLRYDLAETGALCLPFAFAGDPFQTINPTGFRWKGVKAAFHDEVIMAVDPEKMSNVRITFRELSNNYRSTPPIVRSINLIQLWRRVLLGYEELIPQEIWREGESFPSPKKFILGKNISAKQLAGRAYNTIIIVPAEEDRITDYIQSDPVLSQIISERSNPSEEESDPPKNVLSAIEAKGLGFNRVILYKFGESCDPKILQIEGDGNNNNLIKKQYFFNKLYVAASRAKKYLFIVDSVEGDNRLWAYAGSRDKIDSFLDRVVNREEWEDTVGIIEDGLTTAEIEEDNPLIIARQFESQGEEQRSPNLLRRAKQYYYDAGELEKAALCEAGALRAERNYEKAGDKFLSQKKINEAVECFWDGSLWRKLLSCYNEYFRDKPRKYQEIANFMVSDKKDVDAVNKFSKYLYRYIEHDDCGDHFKKPWREAVMEFGRRLSSLDKQVFPIETWQKMGSLLKELAYVDYSSVLTHAGHCYYCAGHYENAVKCWEKTENKEKLQNYYIAKFNVIGFPDGLKYLEKAGDEDLILNEWEKAGGLDRATERRWLMLVGPTLKRKGEFWEAFKVYLKLSDEKMLLEYFEKNRSGFPADKEWEGIYSLVTYLKKRGHWADALFIMYKYFPSAIGYDEEKATLQREFIQALAYSDQTTINPGEYNAQIKNPIIKYILKNTDRQLSQYVKEAGTVIEKIGTYLDALKFYTKFLNHEDDEIKKFARRRWIANKRKQNNHYQEQLEQEKVWPKENSQTSDSYGEMRKKELNLKLDRIRSELKNKYRIWGLPENIEIPDFPDLIKERYPVILGIDKNEIENMKDGLIRFRVASFEVTINGSLKLVSIIDSRDLTNLRVNFNNGDIRGTVDFNIKLIEDAKKGFEVPGGYSGIMYYGRHGHKLELNVPSKSVTVILSPQNG